MYKNDLNTTVAQSISHKKRFKNIVSIFKRYRNQNGKVLDFGTGDAATIDEYLKVDTFRYEYFGYDISEKMLSEASEVVKNEATLTTDLESISNLDFGYISCFETLEHIPDKIVPSVLDSIYELLSDEGVFVISVPIESGISSLFKNIIRAFSDQRERIATLSAIILSFLYMPYLVVRE